MQFKHSPESGGGSKNFLKLEDGEKIKGIFRGDPYVFFAKWENGRSLLTAESDAEGRFRFRINFVIRENGALIPKIWEAGPTVYSMLKDLHESDYNLEETVVQVGRKGTGKNTMYSVLPLPGKNGEVNPELKKALDQIELLNLVHNDKNQDSDDEEEPKF